MAFARVAVPLPVHGLFTYVVDGPVSVGGEVLVPFGKRKVNGWVVELLADPDVAAPKPVEAILAEGGAFTEDQLRFYRWVADYYLSPLGEVIAAATPPGEFQPTPPEAWRVLGTVVPRLDGPAKLGGQARYGIDAREEGQLFAAIAHACPQPRSLGSRRGKVRSPARVGAGIMAPGGGGGRLALRSSGGEVMRYGGGSPPGRHQWPRPSRSSGKTPDPTRTPPVRRSAQRGSRSSSTT